MSAQCAKPIYVFRTCEHDLRKHEGHLSMHLIWLWIHFRILPAFFGNPCIYLHSIPIVGLRSKLEVWDKTSHAGMGPEISRQLASACVNRFNAVRNLTKSSLQLGRLCGEIIGWDGPLNRGEAKPYWINLNLSIGSTTKTCALAQPPDLTNSSISHGRLTQNGLIKGIPATFLANRVNLQ